MNNSMSRFRRLAQEAGRKVIHKTIVGPLTALLVALAPMNAQADCASCFWAGYLTACTECALVFEQLVELINTSTDYIVQNIDMTRQTLSRDIRDATDSIVASIEKSDGAMKEMTQSSMNYQGTLYAKEATARAEDLFVSKLGDIQDPESPANACSTAATSEAATSAARNARITGRAETANDMRMQLYTSNASKVADSVLQTHNQNFCSAEDAKRGRCQGAVKLTMQNANLSAGSLLTPVAAETYSKDELMAAKEYVRMVTGPVPFETLSISAEKTEAGKAYVLEQRMGAAIQSMASHSLNQIFAAHAPESDLAGPGSSISVVGFMKKVVEERFGDPKYRENLATLTEHGLLIQIAHSMAFKNWMDYHAYLQGERSEALLATTLAMNARDRSETRLTLLRSKATATK